MATFGNRPTKSILVAEIETWLHSLELAPQTINNFRAILASFFEYALKRELIDKNPVSAVRKVKLVDKPPEIFKPDELAKLLAACPPALLPALVIQAFAGLRTAEVLRSEWSDIDLSRGFINVSARKSKTRQTSAYPDRIEPDGLASTLRGVHWTDLSAIVSSVSQPNRIALRSRGDSALAAKRVTAQLRELPPRQT